MSKQSTTITKPEDHYSTVPSATIVQLPGFCVTSLPSIAVDAHFLCENAVIDLNFARVLGHFAINSDRIVSKDLPDNSFGFFQKDTEARIQCDNPSDGLLLEIKPERCAVIEAEAFGERSFNWRNIEYESDVQVPQLGRHLLEEVARGAQANRMLLESLSLSVAIQAMRRMQAPPALSAVTGLKPQRFARVLDYIHTHLDEDLSIELLAAVACPSPYHFLRSFKAALGETPHALVTRLRIERGCYYLAQAVHPIADIAVSLGFVDQAHFTRVFHTQMGITPSKYRREQKR
jgi:AraC-like DNA-binding protein